MRRESTIIDHLRLRIKYAILIIVYFSIGFVPSNDDLWVFTAGSGNRFSGNSKYLYLQSNQGENDIRPIWISNEGDTVSLLLEQGYEAYNANSLRGQYYLLYSGRFFYTHGNPFWPYIRNASVTQLWHGTSLKTMGGDKKTEGQSGVEQKIYSELISENWDEFAVTSDRYPLSKFESAFKLDKKRILEAGYPRNDVLFREITDSSLGQEEIGAKFNRWGENGPVILYMPTWRCAYGEQNGQQFSPSLFPLCKIDSLMDQHNGKFILKFHPAEDVCIDVDDYENIFLLSKSIDMYPLLDEVDVLITDYSSIFVDYLLLDRPLIFYPYDRDSYEHDRGFHFNYDENTPGPQATSPEELLMRIKDSLEGKDQYERERERVRNRFHAHIDGRASDRLIQSTREK